MKECAIMVHLAEGSLSSVCYYFLTQEKCVISLCFFVSQRSNITWVKLEYVHALIIVAQQVSAYTVPKFHCNVDFSCVMKIAKYVTL